MKTKFLTLLFAILFANVTASAQGAYTCGIFTFDAIITPPTCNGDCDGSIQIYNLSGGTPPYFTFWSNGDTTPNPTGLCSGDYTVFISDNVGDTCSMVLNVSVPLPITFSLNVIHVSCYGSCDGIIYVDSLSDGVGSYTFQWNDPLLQTTTIADSLCQGTYTVCVTDDNFCVTCDTATVLEPAEIQVTENVTNESCLGCCDGAIELLPIGGTPPYNYVFTPSGSSINLCPGIYDWCVTDAMGCFTCDTVVVSFPTSIKNNSDATIFSVYPNPFKDKIYLNTTKQFVEVYTVLGEKILHGYTNKIDLTTTKSGMYFIVIKDSDGTPIYKEKIVKE